jgi:hypothetical protein
MVRCLQDVSLIPRFLGGYIVLLPRPTCFGLSVSYCSNGDVLMLTCSWDMSAYVLGSKDDRRD